MILWNNTVISSKFFSWMLQFSTFFWEDGGHFPEFGTTYWETPAFHCLALRNSWVFPGTVNGALLEIWALNGLPGLPGHLIYKFSAFSPLIELPHEIIWVFIIMLDFESCRTARTARMMRMRVSESSKVRVPLPFWGGEKARWMLMGHANQSWPFCFIQPIPSHSWV